MAILPSVPGIPTPVSIKDTEAAAVLRPLKESIEIISRYLEANPIIQPEVVNPNTAAEEGNSTSGSPIYYVNGVPVDDGYNPTTDYTPPPPPGNLSIQGAFTNIILEWNVIPDAYRNHAYTEIWRASVDAIGAAVLIGFTPGSVFSDAVGTRQSYFYWIRHVSQANIPGPYNAIAGTRGQTALDPAYVLETLSGQITSSQLVQDLSSRIALIDAPDTTPGSVSARITAQSITQQTATSAIARQVTQLSSSVGSNSAAIEVEAQTRASVDGGLLAQYTVKVDVNGRVSGFGLASTNVSGTPISSFVVIADKFAVVSPAATGQTPQVPFVIGVVDGITRVAMTNAFIQDAAITNAKIANLAVDAAKIANAAISTAKIGDAQITTAKIADANITTAKIQDASITNAKIGSLAVGTAQIQTAAITNAKIGNAAVDTLTVAGNAITAASVFQTIGEVGDPAGGGNTTIVSGTVTTSGTQPILVTLSAFIGGGLSPTNLNSSSANVIASVILAGQIKEVIPSLTVPGGTLACGTGAVLFTGIPAGTHNISATLNCFADAGVFGAFARNPSLIVLETKR